MSAKMEEDMGRKYFKEVVGPKSKVGLQSRTEKYN